MVATFKQLAFRGRNDDGAEATATWKAIQDTDWTQACDVNFRVRFLIDEQAGGGWLLKNFNLFYSYDGGAFAAVTTSTLIYFSLSGNFADDDDTTSQLAGGVGTFVIDNNGMKEATGGVTNTSVSGYYFETEWCLRIESTKVSDGKRINLRIYDGATPISSYDEEPIITISGASSSSSSSTTSSSTSISTSSSSTTSSSTTSSSTSSSTTSSSTSSASSISSSSSSSNSYSTSSSTSSSTTCTSSSSTSHSISSSSTTSSSSTSRTSSSSSRSSSSTSSSSSRSTSSSSTSVSTSTSSSSSRSSSSTSYSTSSSSTSQSTSSSSTSRTSSSSTSSSTTTSSSSSCTQIGWIDDVGLAVYQHFYKGYSTYFGLPDAAGIDITGELTFGCWVYFSPGSTTVDMGIMSKWYTTGNQRAYLLHKDASNNFQLRVSVDGSAIAQVNDAHENFAQEEWFYVVGRFTPSTELALFVNGTWYLNTAAIPASIKNSSEPLEIGRYNRTNYLDGRACHAFICAYAVPNRFIEAMYAHTRAMFKPNTFGQFI